MMNAKLRAEFFKLTNGVVGIAIDWNSYEYPFSSLVRVCAVFK